MQYLQQVLRSCEWTVGPDKRAPEDRRQWSIVQQWHGTSQQASFSPDLACCIVETRRDSSIRTRDRPQSIARVIVFLVACFTDSTKIHQKII